MLEPISYDLRSVSHGLSCSTMARITTDCNAMRPHEHQMALITSDCDAMCPHVHQMALITSGVAKQRAAFVPRDDEQLPEQLARKQLESTLRR